MMPPGPPRSEKKRFRIRHAPDTEPLLFAPSPSGVPFFELSGDAEGGLKTGFCFWASASGKVLEGRDAATHRIAASLVSRKRDFRVTLCRRQTKRGVSLWAFLKRKALVLIGSIVDGGVFVGTLDLEDHGAQAVVAATDGDAGFFDPVAVVELPAAVRQGEDVLVDGLPRLVAESVDGLRRGVRQPRGAVRRY